MTVEQAVLNEIIGHVRKGVKRIPIHLIEQAHSEHQLSGRARLRGLRLKGLVSYAYREDDNTYEIFTPLSELERAWDFLKIGNVMIPKSAASCQPPVTSHQSQKTKDKEEEMSKEEHQRILTEMRAFRSGLGEKVKKDMREEMLRGAGR